MPQLTFPRARARRHTIAASRAALRLPPFSVEVHDLLAVEDELGLFAGSAVLEKLAA